MKSCSSIAGAAYSRPVLALAGTAREMWLKTRRGGLMERWAYLHRFALILCASLFFVAASLASAGPKALAHPEIRAAQATLPPSASTPQSVAPTSSTAEQTRTEQYTLSHERQAKAVAYSRAGYTLYFVSYFLGGLLLYLILDVLKLPVHLLWHSLSLHYQQSVQGWGSWCWDWSKGELLDISFGIVLVLILFAVMRRSPRRWWLYFWFPAVLILFGLMVISPLVIDPLFNKFEPLNKEHPDLVASIEKLTKHAGVPIPAERIFLMEASRKTNAINAYVTGLGASKRVVVWDTTIQKTSNDECLFIVGHELGHYVLGHVRQGFLVGAAGLLLALLLLFRGLHWALDRWARDWKLYGQEDWASLAVILLLLQVLLFVSSPVISGYSRMQEHAADVYGLEVIHGLVSNSDEVAAHAFQVLGELDLSDPNPPPFITFWLYSHPPLADRLVFAHSYDPWSKRQSPKYVK